MSPRPPFSATPATESPSKFLAVGQTSTGQPASRFAFGQRSDGLLGAEGSEVEVMPLEFESVTAVALLFAADNSIPSLVAPVFDLLNMPELYFYSDSLLDGDPGGTEFRFDVAVFVPAVPGPLEGTPPGRLTIAAITTELGEFLTGHADELTVRFEWGAGSFLLFTADEVEVDVDGTFHRMALELVDSWIESALPTLAELPLIRFSARGEDLVSNAAARARVSYQAGSSREVTFDCDWAGGCVVHASRVVVSRVAVKEDPHFDYVPGNVGLTVTAVVGAPRAPHALTLTELPVVATPDGDGAMIRQIPIPSLARRVSLLMTYAHDPAVPASAPLGQLFLTFLGRQRSSPLHWCDVMSCREALLGDGIVIPAGSVMVALTNRTDPLDESIELGAVFHLSV